MWRSGGLFFFTLNYRCLYYLELTKECEKLKKGEAAATGEEGVAWEELQVVRGERDKAVHEAKTLRQTVTGLDREKRVRTH